LRDGDIFIKDAEDLELLDIAEAQIEAAEFLGDTSKTYRCGKKSPPVIPCPLRSGRGMTSF
jgi:hypothetical protein